MEGSIKDISILLKHSPLIGPFDLTIFFERSWDLELFSMQNCTSVIIMEVLVVV